MYHSEPAGPARGGGAERSSFITDACEGGGERNFFLMFILGYLLGVDGNAQTSSVPQRLNLLGGHVGEHRSGCAQGIKCLPPVRGARLVDSGNVSPL